MLLNQYNELQDQVQVNFQQFVMLSGMNLRK